MASRSKEAVRTLPRSSTTNPAGGLGSDVGSEGSGARLYTELESVVIALLLLFFFFLLLFFEFLLLEERFFGGTVEDSEALQITGRSVRFGRENEGKRALLSFDGRRKGNSSLREEGRALKVGVAIFSVNIC